MREIRSLICLLAFVLILAGSVRGSDAQSEALAELFGQGTAAQAQGNHQEAVRIFREVVASFEREGPTASSDAGLVLAKLGESLLALSDPEADKTFDKALPLLRRASDPGPYLNVAFALAEVRLAQGRKGEAASLAEGILSRASEAGVPESILARAIDASAAIFRYAEHHEKADAAIQAALRLTGTDPQASSLRGLARVFRARAAQKAGRYAEMDREVTLGLADLERSGPGSADSMAAMLMLRAHLRFSEGRYKVALDETESAVRKVIDAKLPEQAWMEVTALRVRLLGWLDRAPEAIALAGDFSATLAGRHGATHENTLMARLMLVESLLRGLRYDEARAEIAALAPALGASDHPYLRPTFDLRRGDLALVDGDVVAALAAAKSAYNVSVKAFPHSPTAIVEPLRLRASATTASDDIAFAELAHRELLELSEQAYGTKHPEYGDDLSAFAAWLSGRLRFGEAETLYRRAADLFEASYGPDSAKFATALSNIAITVVQDHSRAAEAAELLERALAITDKLGDLPEKVALLRFNLAASIVFLGRYQEALDLNEEARRIYLTLPAPKQQQLFMFDASAMQSLAALGRMDEALEVGVHMANTAEVETTEDLHGFIQGLSGLARLAYIAGDGNLGLQAARRAMEETGRLGHEGGRAYRLSATALVGSAWSLSQKAP
jgi:tetratricopeptide (TPR) repeat protein